jgi:hypothetical protein
MEKKAAILITVCVEIMVIVFFEFFVFITPTQQSNDPYSTIYYDEFNKTPTPAYTYTFFPPVSMYHALLIALESGGWNATSLENMAISAELDFCAFSFNSFRLVYRVTSQPVDWSPQQINDTTYRYVWTIIVGGPGFIQSIPPPGYYWVDAATGELVPTGIL